ncbi:unnamed protein product, partial [Meganyctiphanes norvegica]
MSHVSPLRIYGHMPKELLAHCNVLSYHKATCSKNSSRHQFRVPSPKGKWGGSKRKYTPKDMRKAIDTAREAITECKLSLASEYDLLRCDNENLTLYRVVNLLHLSMLCMYVCTYVHVYVCMNASHMHVCLLAIYLSNFLQGSYRTANIKNKHKDLFFILAAAQESFLHNTVAFCFATECHKNVSILLSFTYNSHHRHVFNLLKKVSFFKYSVKKLYSYTLFLGASQIVMGGLGQPDFSGVKNLNNQADKFVLDDELPWGNAKYPSTISMNHLNFLSKLIGDQNEHFENLIKTLAPTEAELHQKYFQDLSPTLTPITIVVHCVVSPLQDYGKDQHSSTQFEFRDLQKFISLIIPFYGALYMLNTIDTNFEGPKCIITFSVILPSPDVGFWDHFWHVLDFFFKIIWSRIPLKNTISDPKRIGKKLASLVLNIYLEYLPHFDLLRRLLKLGDSVGIVHRLLCYQKRNSVRLSYNWKDLWAALIALAKFLVTNEAYLAKKMNIFQLAHQVMNIFNLFITYGDTFLSAPSSYDELYYEIMRMHQV